MIAYVLAKIFLVRHLISVIFIFIVDIFIFDMSLLKRHVEANFRYPMNNSVNLCVSLSPNRGKSRTIVESNVIHVLRVCSRRYICTGDSRVWIF